MHSDLRTHFNRSFDPRRADGIRERLTRTAGERITFPLSDTPLFIPETIARRLCSEIAAFFSVIRSAEYRSRAESWVPPQYRVESPDSPVPAFSQFDFLFARSPEGRTMPYLVECQGLSSLIGVVPFYGHLMASELGEGVSAFLGHEGWEEYLEDLRLLLAGAALVDVDPPTQRLRTDFGVLRKLTGVEIVDLDRRTIRRLHRRDIPVYSRIVPIEAEEAGRGAILAELCGAPVRWLASTSWYFLLSKRSLPHLAEVSDLVPRTAELTAEVIDRWYGQVDYVLKPANDFAGRRVRLDPTLEDLDRALAGGEPHVLQERLRPVPVVRPPQGPPLYCDLRVLCQGELPVSLFCRMARTQMTNISFNANWSWCGISSGLVVSRD